MCFFESGHVPGISRAEVLKQLAVLGSFPLLGGVAPYSPSAPVVNDGAPLTALTGGTALLGDTLTPVANATIVLQGNRILAAGPASDVAIPKGAQRIDVRGRFVLPGLIDSHVHFFQSGGLFTRPDAIDLRAVMPYTDELATIDANLPDTFARYLRAGITSVSDVGGPFWNYDVRTRAMQSALAPRMVTAGPLISSVEREILSPSGDPPIVQILDPEKGRALVRREAERKTDFVKFWWIVSPTHPAKNFVPVAKAAMDESKALGLRIAVHATELETATLAAQTGTNILVHSVFDKDVDDAFVALLKERNIMLCPTLRVSGGYQTTFAEKPDLSIVDLRWANPEVTSTLFMLADIPAGEDVHQRVARANIDPVKYRAAALRNLKRLHDAGITIAAGTDAGNIGTLHASSMYAELATMVDAGLTPHEVLVTATLNGAKHMAREHDLGTIAAGKLADLLVLDRNPLEDIRNVATVHLVVKDGRAYDPATIVPDTPEQVVQRHVNAFNAHNAQALSELYTASGEFSDTIADVHTPLKIREYFTGMFERNPNVHAKVTSRSSNGDSVTVEQELSAFADGRRLSTRDEFSISSGGITAAQSRPAA